MVSDSCPGLRSAALPWLIRGLLLCCGLLVGCAKRGPAPSDTDGGGPRMIRKADLREVVGADSALFGELRRRSTEPVLEPGDVITLAIYDKLPVSQEARQEIKRVNGEGTVFIVPVGEIAVAGLTLSEAEKAVEERLGKLVVSPYCEIAVKEKAVQPKVYVFGEVGEPGTFELKPGFRLLDALSAADGCVEDAYRRSIKLVRIQEQELVMYSIDLHGLLDRGEVANNLILRDQDVVFVPRRFYTNFREVMQVLGQLLPWYYFARNIPL